MRAETLFRAIGEVDEAMLQDAVAAAAQPVKRRPPVRFGAGLATAACAALLAAAVLGTAVHRGGLASGGTQQAKNSLQSSGAPAAQDTGDRGEKGENRIGEEEKDNDHIEGTEK